MANPKYLLQRDYHASLRMDIQHWHANIMKPYLIHPSIRLPPHAIIANIGGKTGSWMFQAAQELDPSVSFDGLDDDVSQLPNPNWMPKNVRGVKLDVYGTVPEELRNRYDLIHVRWRILGIKDQDPTSFIEQLKILAKPGAYIQWTEKDLLSTTVVKASPEINSRGTEKLQDAVMKHVAPRVGGPPGWPARLPEIFKACGLVDVMVDHHEVAPEFLPSLHDSVLAGYGEVSRSVPNGDEIRMLLDEAAAEYAASNRGIAINSPFLTVVGRFPDE